jgi:hypothetical protein
MFPNHAPYRAKRMSHTAWIVWMVGDMIAGS